MYYEPKEIRLKDGRTALFRSPLLSDAAELIEYLKITAEETDFLLRTPEECNLTLEQEENYIRHALTSNESLVICCFEKGNAKEGSNNHTIALISHVSKTMLKILQARLKQYVNHELPDVQAGFRKCRGTTDQIVNICWIIKKAIELQKNIYFCFIDYAKAFDCVSSVQSLSHV